MKKHTHPWRTVAIAIILITAFAELYTHTARKALEGVESIASYTIDGVQIPLEAQMYEYATAPSSASKSVVKYFGNEVRGDFDGDGHQDRAFLVTRTTGGSGTFFYLVTSLGGEAAFLGDRIAPQTTEWKDGYIIVNFAERKPGEPMTRPPSVGVSKYFKVKNGILSELE